MSVTVVVDLRNRFGAARDQGGRPTCMAFATSDTHSFARNTVNFLSVEYAHYSATHRRSPVNPDRGVPMRLMIEAIRENGQPPEEVWPYFETLPSPISKWIPPNPCKPIFKHAMESGTPEVSAVLRALDSGQPALLAIRITEQFHQPAADFVIRELSGDRETGNHAIIAVGHGTSNRDSVILVRNSWGKDWGDLGHAWVSKDYVTNRLLGIALPFKSSTRTTI